MKNEFSLLPYGDEEQRRHIQYEHKKRLDSLLTKHPQLKTNYEGATALRKQIISATLGKLQGEAPDPQIVAMGNRLAELLAERKRLLAELKIGEDLLEPRWNCQQCQDTGLVLSQGSYLPCPCVEAKRTNFFRQQANLPLRYALADFCTVKFDVYEPELRPQAKKIYNYVKKFCAELKNKKGSDRGLYIHGPTGSGKSYLLGCVVNYLIDSMSVRYLVYADFLDQIRASFNRDAQETEQELMEAVKKVDLLLLDDLGTEKPSEFSLKYLAQIVDYRYRNLKPMVVTSNFTLKELIERSKTDLYGERIVWRLGEMCSNLIELKGNLRIIL